jgi:hypothetical protein
LGAAQTWVAQQLLSCLWQQQRLLSLLSAVQCAVEAIDCVYLCMLSAVHHHHVTH